jgi:hypothetical protein
MTIKLSGPVEPYFQDVTEAPAEAETSQDEQAG